MRARFERLVRGDTWRRAWLLRDAAGQAVDLSSASARLQVRGAAGALVVECSTANGRLVVHGPEGRIDVALAWPDAEALTPGRYVYDLEITRADERTTIDRALLLVVEDVTR